MRPTTKPGRHGTLYLYSIRYDDGPDSPAFACRVWAYNREHALEKFYESDDGFRAVAIANVPSDALAHRMHWEAL